MGCEDVWWAGFLAFMTTFFMWSINYVAQEIEDPFGGDDNDLPLHAMQSSFNDSLATLLMQHSQSPPVFTFDKHQHRILRLSVLTGEFLQKESDAVDHLPILRRQATNSSDAPQDKDGRSSKRSSAYSQGTVG